MNTTYINSRDTQFNNYAYGRRKNKKGENSEK